MFRSSSKSRYEEPEIPQNPYSEECGLDQNNCVEKGKLHLSKTL